MNKGFHTFKPTLLQDDIKLLPEEPIILIISDDKHDKLRVKDVIGDSASVHFGSIRYLDYLAGICVNKVYFVDTNMKLDEFLWLKTRVRKPYSGQVGESKTTKTAVLRIYDDGEIVVSNI